MGCIIIGIVVFALIFYYASAKISDYYWQKNDPLNKDPSEIEESVKTLAVIVLIIGIILGLILPGKYTEPEKTWSQNLVPILTEKMDTEYVIIFPSNVGHTNYTYCTETTSPDGEVGYRTENSTPCNNIDIMIVETEDQMENGKNEAILVAYERISQKTFWTFSIFPYSNSTYVFYVPAGTVLHLD